MKVIIAGSRDLFDPSLVEDAVKASKFDVTEVICGGAAGIDTIGRLWAEERGIPVTPFWPDWDRYGKSAGPRRNQEMAGHAEALIAVLWETGSRGTENMIKEAKKLRLPMYIKRVPR